MTYIRRLVSRAALTALVGALVTSTDMTAVGALQPIRVVKLTYSADAATLGAIPDGGSGPGNFGPSRDARFNVAGLTGEVNSIELRLQMTHNYVGDLDVVLKSPAGARSLAIFSRTGATTFDDFGFNSELTAGADYTFSDSAAGDWWAAAATSPVRAGSYRSSVAGPTSNPAAPSNLNSVFGGLSSNDANGTWTLSVRDGAALDTGTLTGARLTIGTTGASVLADHDGDAKADIAVFRPPSGQWFTLPSSGAPFTSFGYGASDDIAVPGDYDGDRRTDVAIYRPSTGLWAIRNSASRSDIGITLGTATDMPVPADYDGDGRADVAIFRPSTGLWVVRGSSGGADVATTFGASGDIAVPADYDGDAKADIGVFRPSTGTWFAQLSGERRVSITGYGGRGDVPLPGDYDGDGKADVAIFRPSVGLWAVNSSRTRTDRLLTYGIAIDTPVPADYDGDGRTDIAVLRPVYGTWFVQRSSNGVDVLTTFGIEGDDPLALPAAVRELFYR